MASATLPLLTPLLAPCSVPVLLFPSIGDEELRDRFFRPWSSSGTCSGASAEERNAEREREREREVKTDEEK